jgi:phosphatidylserine synthase
MTSEIIQWLAISSMILFHIICVLGILTLVNFNLTINRIANKMQETVDLTQLVIVETVKAVEDNSKSILGEIVVSIFTALIPFKKKSRWQKFLEKFDK